MKRHKLPAMGLALLFVLIIGQDLRELHLASEFNRLLDDGLYIQAGEHPSVRGRITRAYALQRRGRFEEPVEVYTNHLAEQDSVLSATVEFNLATLYLSHALQTDGLERDVRTPLIELAKEHYRAALRHRPDDWDARHNLELALRVQPDFSVVNEEQTVTPERTPRAPRAPLGYGGLP